MNEEQQRLFKDAVGIIQPYMIIAGRERKAVASDDDRARIKEGIALMEEAIKFSPVAWRGLWIIGKAHQALGDKESAYSAFQRAYTLDSTNPDVCREYMHACLATGRGAEAVEAARVGVSRNRQDAGLVANLALALLIGGDLAEAERTCKAAQEMNPEDKITANVLKVISEVRAGKRPRPTRL
jgi:Flp pilus assembly protein TadD